MQTPTQQAIINFWKKNEDVLCKISKSLWNELDTLIREDERESIRRGGMVWKERA